ncbi:MAG: GNAT family N-acetyltransferase [bacterium]
MNVDLLSPDSPRWREFLDSVPHDVYHRPEYARLSRLVDGGEPVGALLSDGDFGLFIPLLLRNVESGGGGALRDAISPYGYPGPLLRGSGRAAEEFLRQALVELESALRQQGVVSVLVRMHPLYPLPGFFYDLPGVSRHGVTLSSDLALSAEELWHATRRGHRTEIAKAEREGRQQVTVDADWDVYDDFRKIYDETLDRLTADAYYYYPEQYFAELKRTLGDYLHLAVNRIDGEVAFMMVFSECCGIIQTHLGGVSDKFVSEHPLKLVHHKARLWAKERGNRFYHLGGGVGAQADSVFYFKEGFANLRHPYHTWRMIPDPEQYRALVADWERRSGTAADGLDGWFPAYRKAPARPAKGHG